MLFIPWRRQRRAYHWFDPCNGRPKWATFLLSADQRRRRATRETTMDHDRRAFLKTTSLAAAAAAASMPPVSEAAAQTRSAPGELKELPKGLVLATLRRSDGFGLGLRTDRHSRCRRRRAGFSRGRANHD